MCKRPIDVPAATWRTLARGGIVLLVHEMGTTRVSACGAVLSVHPSVRPARNGLGHRCFTLFRKNCVLRGGTQGANTTVTTELACSKADANGHLGVFVEMRALHGPCRDAPLFSQAYCPSLCAYAHCSRCKLYRLGWTQSGMRVFGPLVCEWIFGLWPLN